MRKKLLTLILLISFFAFFTPSCLAGSFNLKSIGTLNTDGKLYPQWWYTSLQPTFAGEALASSNIDITIDNEAYQATADASGNWSFTPPAALTAGDHSIALTNEGATINFTLTLGGENIDWDSISSDPGTTLPTVGFIWPTIFMFSTGLLFVYFSQAIEKKTVEQ